MHKDVLCLTDESGGEPQTVYVKRQWTWDRRWPRWSDWRDGVARVPDPVLEWRGLRTLADIGLSVPQPLRLLTDSDPCSPRAAIVMSAVPVAHSLADFARRGDLLRLDPFVRRSLAVALMETADRLHARGLRWRSMKAKHIYPQFLGRVHAARTTTKGGAFRLAHSLYGDAFDTTTPVRNAPSAVDGLHAPYGWRLWLIDCEGLRPRATRRQQRRDRRLLLRSLQTCGADAAFVEMVGAK